MRFKPGDPVWAHCDRADVQPPLVGRHAATVEKRVTWLMRKLNRRLQQDTDYLIEVSGRPGPFDGLWGASAMNLTPRRDDDLDDSFKAGEWDECPWRPSVSTVRANEP